MYIIYNGVLDDRRASFQNVLFSLFSWICLLNLILIHPHLLCSEPTNVTAVENNSMELTRWL